MCLSRRQLICVAIGIVCLVVPVEPVLTQDGAFTATVNQNRIAMGEHIEVTFTLSGAGGGKGFRPPKFDDFLVLSGPNQSTSMQFINGAVSSSVSYSYILQPRAEGKYTIGPASSEYGGKQLQTKPITIEVTKGASPQAGGQRQQPQSEDAEIHQQLAENLFLKASVDRARVFQGEQITATYKIYTRVDIANYNLVRNPALTGFWSEDLEVPKQIQLTTDVVEGRQFRVGILKKVALFPQRSGTLELDPMEVECVVQVRSRRRSNDIFDQFFNDPFFGNVRNVSYKVRSKPLKITVQPLPSAIVPPGFGGAVGTFSMETWLDKPKTKTNEPVTLKVKITGRGNLKLLEAPSIIIPPDLDQYDPKISDNIARQGDRIAGSRTFEYLLIPRHAGEQRIPSFPFSYFDVERKEYATLRSPEFILSVERGTELSSAPVVGMSREDVKLLGEDIRFIKSSAHGLRRRGEMFVGSPGFVLLSISPVVGFVGFLFFIRRRERVMGDATGLRNRKARKMARRRLNEAKKFLDARKSEGFYGEVSRALWGYVGDKLGIPPADLSLDTIRTSLEIRGVALESISQLSRTLERCEFARFAPSSDSIVMEEVYREALELISTIEDQLR